MDPARMIEGRTRETKIRRDASGRWFNDGIELTHPLLRHAFDRWLERAPDGSGRFCLTNDINWAYVELEGPPRFVRTARIEGDAVFLTLSDEREVELDPATLRQGRDGALYCSVESGGAELAARFDAHAAMQLDVLLGEDAEGVFLNVRSGRARPPVVDDPLA